MRRARAATQRQIRQIFRTLEAAMGPQHWWPAGSAFEVVVGAYLTQNTAWSNVERAIGNLRRAGVLSVAGIRDATIEDLEQLVRPAGYFRQKAARLKNFIRHLDARHGGSLQTMFAGPVETLREELLALNGIGPETADSILLYAASGEVFVVDAYTRRIFERHGLARAGNGYEEIRAAVEMALGRDLLAQPTAGQQRVTQVSAAHSVVRGVDSTGQRIATGKRSTSADGTGGGASSPEAPTANLISIRAPSPVAAQMARQISIHPPSSASEMVRSELSRRYNEFHALLVQTGKHFCLKATPRCEACPLRGLLPKLHPR